MQPPAKPPFRSAGFQASECPISQVDNQDAISFVGRDLVDINSVFSSASQESAELGIPREELKSSLAVRVAQYENKNVSQFFLFK